jgi:hypothetical protein
VSEEQKQAALKYILDAWEEALHDGIEPEMFANAAFFRRARRSDRCLWRRCRGQMTNGLSRRIHHGEFTLKRTPQ